MSTSTVTLPDRPLTPTLDLLFAKYGKGAERYTPAVPPGVGFTDAALELFHRGADFSGAPIDLSFVSLTEVITAQRYLELVWNAALANGGFTPPAAPAAPAAAAAQPLQPIVQANPGTATGQSVSSGNITSGNMTPIAPSVPAPAGITSPSADAIAALPPLGPGAVVTQAHHNAFMSLLGTLAHGVAIAATPETFATIAQILTLVGAHR